MRVVINPSTTLGISLRAGLAGLPKDLSGLIGVLMTNQISREGGHISIFP